MPFCPGTLAAHELGDECDGIAAPRSAIVAAGPGRGAELTLHKALEVGWTALTIPALIRLLSILF